MLAHARAYERSVQNLCCILGVTSGFIVIIIIIVLRPRYSMNGRIAGIVETKRGDLIFKVCLY